MRQPTLSADGRVGQAMQVLNARAYQTALVIDAGCLAVAWPHAGTMAALVGLVVIASGINLWVSKVGWDRLGIGWAELLRGLANLVVILLMGCLVHWQAMVLLWLPYTAALTDRSRHRVLVLVFAVDLVVISGAAILGGTPLERVLMLAGIALVVYAIAGARSGVIAAMLEERETQHADLARAHATLAQAQALAIEQEKLSSLGMLAAGIAHEINNPMSFVTSNLSTLAADLADVADLPEPLVEYRDEVVPATVEGVRRVNAIVADLRHFARGDPEAARSYDLAAELATAARIAGSKFGPNCHLHTDLAPVRRVVGRPRQLGQVVVNLLVNAAQAVEDEGEVTLSCREADGGILVTVQDTGCGMDAEVQRHLFQPFFTTKPVGVGTGLGLAVVHGIVTGSGGRIEVESAPGHGSRFTVWLPWTPPGDAAPAATEPIRAAG